MPHRDIEAVRANLSAIVREAGFLAGQLEDIHALAYERAVGEAQEGGRPAYGSRPLDAVGRDDARAAWHAIIAKSASALSDIGFARHSVSAILGGPSPERMRGTLIPRAEFTDALKAKQRRSIRSRIPIIGDYEPHRDEPQPSYPGPKGKPKK
ncbi:MAG: hypothetical protein NVS9B11_18320 [Candidatus Dormibacteraceae bacterium]